MARFRFVAVDGAGKVSRGEMDAADERAVVDAIQGQGRLLLRAEPAGKSSALAKLLAADLTATGARRSLSSNEVARFTRELAVMLRAGQDVENALRFLAETAPSKRVGALVGALREGVRGGKPLSAALAAQGATFSRLYIGLVRAGEAGGSLGTTLDHLAGLLERERALAATVSSALVYPAMLLVAAIGSIALLLLYVLPQFQPIFEQSGADLPALTQAMIGAGAFLGDWGLAMAACIGLAWLGAREAMRRPGPRRAAERAALRVPVVRGLLRSTQGARLCRTLGTLLGNGVGLVMALGIVREVLTARLASDAVSEAVARVKEGARLSERLVASGAFPVAATHFLRLGEETGQLAEMALRAAEIQEEDVRQTVQRLVALLVPTITILMGAAVAAIVGALLLAMVSLNDLAV